MNLGKECWIEGKKFNKKNFLNKLILNITVLVSFLNAKDGELCLKLPAEE